MRDRFPEAEKMFPVVLDDSLSATATPLVHDPLNFRRYLARTLPKSVHWRDQHAYLLADGVQYDDEACTLAVSGVLRGRALNVQRAVHVPHIGDFLVDRVEIVAPQKHRKKKVVDMATEEKDDASPKISRVVAPRDTDRAVIHEHEPDPMAGEQTWPTEQELLEAEERVKLMREGRGEDGSDGKRIVPKGTSSYQAAWIIDETVLDEDDEVEGDESVKREEDAMMDGPEETATPAHYSEAFGRLSPIREVDEECEEILLEGNASTANTADHASDNDLSDDEEQRQLHAHLHAQQQRTDTLSPADRFLEDLQYPDEIDTPIDTPARVRFQKYRGLKSFRHGDGWDPYEALPRDYARIFQFEDFAGTKRRVLAESEKETMRAASSTSFSAMSLKDNQDGMDVELEDTLVAVGQRVIVHLKEVPSTFRQIYGDDASGVTKPLVLFGLLTHEEKMSVINFTCTRLKKDLNEEEDDEDASNEGVPTIIKSKDPILVQCGFRRYVNRPTYSQHTRGPLYKYERYLVPGRPTVSPRVVDEMT